MSFFNRRRGDCSNLRGHPTSTGNTRGGGYAPRGGSGRPFHGGRGRGGGWNATSTKHTPPPVPDTVKHPLGELLQMYQLSDLSTDSERVAAPAKISDLKYVASYNWMNGKAPTIMIPGKPPMWTPLKEPRQMKPDAGEYFRDPNSARYPRHPTEPAVQAILSSDPAFPTSDIDIVACGNTMGNLLRFVRSVGKPFRFSVEVVGNTLFFVRKENDPREVIQDIRGFGHSFPEAYTTWEKELKGSESHQRLVQYEFGGLNCVLRFECDGYLEHLATSHKKRALDEKVDDVDISRDLEATSVSHTLSDMAGPLNIKWGGGEVPQGSVFDLKTRSGRYRPEIDKSDILPVLWLKQIPNFIVAYHNGAGLFQKIRVQDIRKEVQEWEAENKTAIRHLAVLLQKIIDIARSDKRGLLDVYCPSDRLEVRKQHGEGSYSLSSLSRTKWEGSSEETPVISETAPLLKETIGYGGFEYDSDDEDEDEKKDFTACDTECGYCGDCSY